MAPPSRASQSRRRASVPPGQLVRLPLPENDAGLVVALRAGSEEAREEVVRRYCGDVERVLQRVLGPDPEVEDLTHEVFLAALTSLHRLRDPSALRSWLIGIALRKVRRLVLRRRRFRLVLGVLGEAPEGDTSQAPIEVSEALRSTYRILSRIAVDDRIAFALRYIDGMPLTAVAEATDVSLATAKRRIARAHRRFIELARKNDVLAPWVGDGELDP